MNSSNDAGLSDREERTPKTYPSRSGTSDSGREYELKIAALLLLRCVGQKETEHGWLAMNVDECGAFDDVVLSRQRKDGKKAIYLVQLKHEDKGSDIAAGEFKSKKKTSPFSLEKYTNSIKQIAETKDKKGRLKLEKGGAEKMVDYLSCNRDDIVFVLFTNRGITSGCDFLKRIGEKSDTDRNFMLYESLNTSAKGNVFAFDYETLNIKYDEEQCFMDKLFLFTNQENINTVNKALANCVKTFIQPVSIPNKLLSSITLQFLQFLTEWSKGSLGGFYPITRIHIIKKLAELLLAPYMVTPDNPGNRILRQALWDQITDDKDVIVINEADEVVVDYVKASIHSVIEEYCPNSEIKTLWKTSIDVIRRDLLAITNKTEKISHTDAYHHLWKTGKVPLLLEVGDPQAAKQVQDILRLSQRAFRFIIFNKSGKPIEKMGTLSVFSNIGDLNQDHQKVILQYPATLQGRKSSSVQLVDLIDDTISKYVTVKDIIYILLGRFNIGNSFEALPEFFQQMSLTRVWLEASALREVRDEMFVIKCDNLTNVNICLQLALSKASNASVSSWANIGGNPGARIIIFEDESLSDIQSFCLAKGQAIHFLVFHGMTNLEWIKSTGTVQNIKPFRTIPEFGQKSSSAKHLVSAMVNNGKSVLISSNPGTGKSVLLNYIAHNAPPDWWVLKINLIEHKDVYKNWDDQNSPELFQSIVDKILTRQDLVQALCRQHLDNKNVVLLLDGFDEVPVSCQGGAEKMITFLNNKGYLMCLTTRPVLKVQLESMLDTFSLTPNLFTRSNQEHFLSNYFSQAAGVLASDAGIESFVEQLLAVSKRNLKDRDNRVTGIPLHVTLLAGVFAQDCIQYLETKVFKNKRFDLLYLYKHFINAKIQIACNKVKGIDEDTIIHYKVCRSLYALRSVFPDLKMLEIDGKLELANKMFPLTLQLIQKDGIVVAESSANVTFIHRTFAEYLAAEWMWENMTGKYKEIIKVLVEESFNPRFEVLRNIFDQFLAKDCPLILVVINRQEEEVKKIVSHDESVFKQRDEGNRTFLHLAASWGVFHSPVPEADHKIVDIEATTADDDMLKILTLIPPEEMARNDQDAVMNYTPLDYAVISGSLQVANFICAKLQKPYYFPTLKNLNTRYPFSYVIKMNYVSFASTLFRFYFSDNLQACIRKPTMEGDISSFCGVREIENKQQILTLMASRNNVDELINLIFCQNADKRSKDSCDSVAHLAISELRDKTDSILQNLDKKTRSAGQSF